MPTNKNGNDNTQYENSPTKKTLKHLHNNNIINNYNTKDMIDDDDDDDSSYGSRSKFDPHKLSKSQHKQESHQHHKLITNNNRKRDRMISIILIICIISLILYSPTWERNNEDSSSPSLSLSSSTSALLSSYPDNTETLITTELDALDEDIEEKEGGGEEEGEEEGEEAEENRNYNEEQEDEEEDSNETIIDNTLRKDEEVDEEFEDPNLFGISIPNKKSSATANVFEWNPFVSNKKTTTATYKGSTSSSNEMSLDDDAIISLYFSELSNNNDNYYKQKSIIKSNNYNNNHKKKVRIKRQKSLVEDNVLAKSPANIKRQQEIVKDHKQQKLLSSQSWFVWPSITSSSVVDAASTASSTSSTTSTKKLSSLSNNNINNNYNNDNNNDISNNKGTTSRRADIPFPLVLDADETELNNNNNETTATTITLNQQPSIITSSKISGSYMHASEVLQCRESVVNFVINATDGKDECDGLIRAFDQACRSNDNNNYNNNEQQQQQQQSQQENEEEDDENSTEESINDGNKSRSRSRYLIGNDGNLYWKNKEDSSYVMIVKQYIPIRIQQEYETIKKSVFSRFVVSTMNNMIPSYWKEYRTYDDGLFDYWFWVKEMKILPSLEFMSDVLTNCLHRFNGFFYYNNGNDIISQSTSTTAIQTNSRFRALQEEEITTKKKKGNITLISENDNNNNNNEDGSSNNKESTTNILSHFTTTTASSSNEKLNKLSAINIPTKKQHLDDKTAYDASSLLQLQKEKSSGQIIIGRDEEVVNNVDENDNNEMDVTHDDMTTQSDIVDKVMNEKDVNNDEEDNNEILENEDENESIFDDPKSIEARTCCASILNVYHELCNQDNEEDISDSRLFFCVSIMAFCGIVKSLIRHYKVLWLPEAAGCIVVGIASGYVINYFPHHEVSFDGNWFLRILVPPIVFEAALSIDKRSFNRHIIPIMIYSVTGTIFATVLTAVIVHYGTTLSPWCMGIPFVEALTFGALISSIDPIAVLSVLSNMGMTDNDTIYVLIFGESLLNDGVAIVLFHTLVHFLDENLIIDQAALNAAAVHFVVVAVGSVLVGVAAGILSTVFFWIFHGCQTPLVEVIMFFCWALLPYYICDGIGWSGIVAAVAVGFFMDVYIVGQHSWKHGQHSNNRKSVEEPNLNDDTEMSHTSNGSYNGEAKKVDRSRRRIFSQKGHLSTEARTHIGFVTEIISTSMETAIFAYLGFFLFSHRYHWNFFHILIAIFACCMSRAIMIPSLGVISNWITRIQQNRHRIAAGCTGTSDRRSTGKPDGSVGVFIDKKMQIVLWFAGLRGAMSFALVEHIPLYDAYSGRGTRFKPELKAMTSACILFTVFVLGGYTYYIMRHLGISPHSTTQTTSATSHETFSLLSARDKDNAFDDDDDLDGIDLFNHSTYDKNLSSEKVVTKVLRRQRHVTPSS